MIIQTRDTRSIIQVAYIISYAEKKEHLGLQRNPIFNQGISFLRGLGGGEGARGRRGSKAICRIVRTSKKILAMPLLNLITLYFCEVSCLRL